MTLASHMGEYFGKTLVLEQWGYKKCTEMQVCCWNRLFEGNMLLLVFSRLFQLSGPGCLVGIEDHTSVYVAQQAVPAGKLCFPGKSRSNQLCMGEGMGCRFCLAWESVDFQELVSNRELLRVDDPCQPHA